MLLSACSTNQSTHITHYLRVQIQDTIYDGGIASHVAKMPVKLWSMNGDECNARMKWRIRHAHATLFLNCGGNNYGAIKLKCFPHREKCLVKRTKSDVPIVVAISWNKAWVETVF